MAPKNGRRPPMKIRRFALWFSWFMLVSTPTIVSFAVSASAGDMIGNCELTGKKGAFPIVPVQAGQLTVQAYLPAPGWWNGDTPDTIKDGFEYCMAANIAYRGGLDKIVVISAA